MKWLHFGANWGISAAFPVLHRHPPQPHTLTVGALLRFSNSATRKHSFRILFLELHSTCRQREVTTTLAASEITKGSSGKFTSVCLWRTRAVCLGRTWKEDGKGTSLVVQWLRLSTSTAGGEGLNPRRGTRIPHAVCCAAKKWKQRWSWIVCSGHDVLEF